MRALLWLLLLAGMAVGLSLAARYNDGYALLVLPPWRVEVSLNFLILVLIGGFLFFHAALRLISAMLRLPASVQAFRAARTRARADAGVRDTLTLLAEGRFARALKRADATYAAGTAPGLIALLALFAARGLRDQAREQIWRSRAAERDREIHHARLMTEASFAVQDRRYAQAKSLLDQLLTESGRQIAALRLALRAEQGLGNWDAVLHLVQQLEKHKALSPEQSAPIRLRAHRENIKALEDNGSALERYLDRMPGRDRRHARIALEMSQALIRARHCQPAARLIEEVLEEEWDPALVNVYSNCQGGDAMGRIAHAEAWLQTHPDDVELLLALGRLCRQLQLWGKAQSYFEASLAIRPGRDGHLELATLFDHLQKPDDANRHYRMAAITV